MVNKHLKGHWPHLSMRGCFLNNDGGPLPQVKKAKLSTTVAGEDKKLWDVPFITVTNVMTL